jgi:caffeoyl-CoA O-methyltransferase
MAEKFTRLTPELYRYLLRYGVRQDDVLRRLVAETASLGPAAAMQISPDEGALLTLLVRSIRAVRAIELGTFTGYSAISIARGLEPGGSLLACDTNPEWTAIARRYFREAGLEDRIELRLGPALETLQSLPSDRTFDFAFVDADKESSLEYVEALLPRLRTGGLLVIDNVLWGGRVLDPADRSPSTEAIRRLNEHLALDPRVDLAMLPVADGITIACKR